MNLKTGSNVVDQMSKSVDGSLKSLIFNSGCYLMPLQPQPDDRQVCNRKYCSITGRKTCLNLFQLHLNNFSL